MNTPQHVFRLDFVSDQNTPLHLTLPLADTTATVDQVRHAMDAIIASGVVSRQGNIPVTRAAARITTQTVSPFAITA